MATKTLKKLSIVIPVFNEVKTIKKVLDKVLKADTLGLEKEIVVVDDGSTDGTTKTLKSLRNSKIKRVFLERNSGKATALRAGFEHTTGDIVLIQDADLEYSPSEYPKLLRPFLEGQAKVVYGSRELSGKNTHSYMSFHLGGKLVTLVTNILFGSSLTDEPTGYKVFRRKTLLSFPLKSKRFEFCPEVTAHTLKRGIEIIEVPISYKPRRVEEGKKINTLDGLEAIWTLFRCKIDL